MGKLVKGAAAAVALLVVGLGAAWFVARPSLLPAAHWQAAIEAQVAATGQTLTLLAPPVVQLTPVPTITTGEFSVASASGPWLEGGNLTATVDGDALLRGELVLEQVTMAEPVVRLHAIDAASNDTPLPAGLQNVTITGGLVLDGDRNLIDSFDAKLQWAGPGQPVRIEGTGSLFGEGCAIDGTIDKPLVFAEGGVSQFDLQLGLPGAEGRVRGEGSLVGEGRFDGHVDLQVGDLRSLVRWLGADLGTGASFHLAHFVGPVTHREGVWTLTGGTVEVDRQPMTGDVTLTMSDPPTVVADLKGTADLAHWLGPGLPLGADSGETEFDAGLLGRVQGKATLALTKSRWGALPVDGTLTAEIVEGTLTVAADLKPTEARACSGRIDAVVTGSERPQVEVRGQLAGPHLGVALDGLLGSDRLSGAGTLTFEGTAAGTTRQELAATLKGTADLQLREGAWKHLDLQALTTSLMPADEDAWADASTPFTEAGCALTASGGVLSIEELRVDAEPALLRGGGEVDLVDPQLALQLDATLQQGARRGRKLPVAVTGAEGKLLWTPDAEALFGAPN